MVKMRDKEYMDNFIGKPCEVACMKANKGMGTNINMPLKK
jgi:hypothetical protein